MSEINELQNEICKWADSVYPDRDIKSAALKLYSEVAELLDNPSDPGEHADIYIMMLDISRMYDVDVIKAIREKMFINRMRRWEVSEIGTMNHIDDSPLTFYDLGVEDYKSGSTKQHWSFFPSWDHYLEYIRGYHNSDGEGDECD